ncbi:MAG: hypothetical protein KA791_14165 [Flavobacteriales bacterium]|nr:hypothetical protein [Flavobacteriales bacterium]
MKTAPLRDLAMEASHGHLSANASECARRNIIIRIDTINADHSVAFCSVSQRNNGLFRRTYSLPELVWRAEQALAPLNGLGILPMINVHMNGEQRQGPARISSSIGTWLQRLREWLGYPQTREVFGTPLSSNDPFGLHTALQLAVVR